MNWLREADRSALYLLQTLTSCEIHLIVHLIIMKLVLLLMMLLLRRCDLLMR